MVEDLNDVGMNQAGCSKSLVPKPVDERWVVSEVLGEQLDSNLPLEAFVRRKVDGAHPARTKAAFKLVTACDYVTRWH